MPQMTVTEIAEAICEADDLRLADHTRAYSQVRTAVRRGLLRGGIEIDKRGTLAFPVTEVYRARIFNALADFSIDLAAVGDEIEASINRAVTKVKRPLGKASAGTQPSFETIIRGARAGDLWRLEIRLYKPGHESGRRLVARLFLEGDPVPSPRVEEAFGTGPAQAVLTLDLVELFRGLPELRAAI